MRKFLLVANPTAQSGRAMRSIDDAGKRMRKRGMPMELLHTEGHGRTPGLVRDRLNLGGIDVVIYLGGDGTFHEVATGIVLAGAQVPLGMLPAGTANDQGLSFGIRRGNLDQNLDVIADHALTMLDVGHIEQLDHEGSPKKESFFFDSCGWGINPDILVARNRQRKVISKIPFLREIYRDKAIYATSAAAKLFQSYVDAVKFSCEVIADGNKYEFRGMTDVVISATAIYAGHWVLDRRGEPDDGKFEFVPMQGRRDWGSKTLRDFAASPIWQEQLDRWGITHSQGFSAKTFEIDLYRPEKTNIFAQVDGEEWGHGDKYKIRVIERLLPLITPRNFVPPWKP